MIYFGLALLCTGIFIFQFILSFILGDLDTDVDFDGDGSMDFDLSGLISFKGILHFGIGFSWSMWLAQGQGNQLLAVGISVFIGCVTAVVLALAYWGALKLKKEIIPEKGEDLMGRTSEVYYHGPGKEEWIVFVEINGGKREISVTSEAGLEYTPGEKAEIIKFKNGKYWIL